MTNQAHSPTHPCARICHYVGHAAMVAKPLSRLFPLCVSKTTHQHISIEISVTTVGTAVHFSTHNGPPFFVESILRLKEKDEYENLAIQSHTIDRCVNFTFCTHLNMYKNLWLSCTGSALTRMAIVVDQRSAFVRSHEGTECMRLIHEFESLFRPRTLIRVLYIPSTLAGMNERYQIETHQEYACTAEEGLHVISVSTNVSINKQQTLVTP